MREGASKAKRALWAQTAAGWEGRLEGRRKRVTDAESARDQLQATARKHGKGVAVANKEAAMKVEELEKQLAAEKAARVEHIIPSNCLTANCNFFNIFRPLNTKK